jgi:signal transduction histidine kinase
MQIVALLALLAPEKHRIVLRTYLDANGMAVAEVEDPGVGIDPGIGIGLGGEIDVESVLGCGTTARVRLPRLSHDHQLLKAG